MTINNLVSCILYLFFPLSAGKNPADAHVHADPAGMSGGPVGGQDEPLLPGAPLRPHLDHPTAHVNDRPTVLRPGDEVCKYRSGGKPLRTADNTNNN